MNDVNGQNCSVSVCNTGLSLKFGYTTVRSRIEDSGATTRHDHILVE